MNAVTVIRKLLADDAALSALVGNRIYTGVIPQGEALPAVACNHVSTVERTTASLKEAATLATSRIDVAVQAKTYPSQKSILAAVRSACKNKSGTIAGMLVHSVTVGVIGPDLRDDDAGIYMQTIEFVVAYTQPN